MRPAWIFRRKPWRLKLLQLLIAVFVLIIIYNSYPVFDYLQREVKPTKLHETLKTKINDKDNGRHEQAGDAQAKSLCGQKKRENWHWNDKVDKNNRKEEISATVAGEDIKLPSTRNTKMIARKIPSAGCKEKGILKSHYDEASLASEVSCVPHLMSEEACRYTKKVYKIDTKLHTCMDNSSRIYCYLKQEKSLEFACVSTDKYKYCKISWLNTKSGDIVVERIVANLSQLSIDLKLLANIATAYKSNFLFLQCFPKIARDAAQTQLILLPYGPVERSRANTERQGGLDINILLLDSISRAHFHRSLPTVLQAFNELNSRDSRAEVLDFELFQSVHGHSAENFHAFFTGKLLPRNMTAAKKEYANVGVENLYGDLKDMGYETMYQDDLCWKYWWGTRMELGMAASWQALQQAIQKSRIDYTGLTFASCKILSLNNLQTPFSGPENSQICLNGRFQHSYIFEHLLQYFGRSGRRKKRFSFTTINTGHDYKGTRVQTLNKDLSTFVKKLSGLKDTLTILMADHGNTYTSYTSTMLEGRFEMYHPSFFMILPESVKKWLGSTVVRNLRRNTKRLFTMIDVHKMIRTIAEIDRPYVARESYGGGLLNPIPTTRRCDDLELALPSLCICDGWDSPAGNDTTQTGVLEFAVGTLNNLIDSQRQDGNKHKPIKQWKCHRLIASSFTHVRERIDKGDLITTLDFMVDSGRGFGRREDVFHVEVGRSIARGSTSMNMVLLSYDRLSQFGIYRQCKDAGVNAKLCVCSLKGFEKHDSHDLLLSDGSISVSALLRNQHQLDNIPSRQTIRQLTESECIFLSTKEFFSKAENVDASLTSVVEIINICSQGSIEIYLDIDTNNCQTSHNFPMVIKADPQSIHFVAVIIRTVWYWRSSYRILASRSSEIPQMPADPHLPPTRS